MFNALRRSAESVATASPTMRPFIGATRPENTGAGGRTQEKSALIAGGQNPAGNHGHVVRNAIERLPTLSPSVES